MDGVQLTLIAKGFHIPLANDRMSALAVFKLMTASYLVGVCTGRSDGSIGKFTVGLLSSGRSAKKYRVVLPPTQFDRSAAARCL
jgi:hypothetical protein